MSRRVVGRAEETSTYSWSRFCTVNCRPTASNYQLSHLRPCREPNPGLRGGRRECYHSATVAPLYFKSPDILLHQNTLKRPEVRRLHKTMQCAYFCIHLSEAINGQSSTIEKHTIHTKYSVTNGVRKNHSYNNIDRWINETGLYNRNKVLRFVLYDLYKRTELPT